jgi:CheY-like chemotaxis protein
METPELVALPPTALVVEDQVRSLAIRSDLLREHGFTPIGVRSAAEAIREYRASPGIDIVLTDVNLVEARRDDKSGVQLARDIRDLNEYVPIIGISAAFAEHQLPKDDWSAFDYFYPKGKSAPEKILERIEDWRKLAVNYRRKRLQWANEQLRRLRDKYQVSSLDFSTLRLLVPSDRNEHGQDHQSIDTVLRLAGYRLKLIEAGAKRPRLGRGVAKVEAPIMVWLKGHGDAVIAEIYGHPELYSYGKNEDEAIRQLLILMDGFYTELVKSNVSDESLTPLTRRLRNFLSQVLG